MEVLYSQLFTMAQIVIAALAGAAVFAIIMKKK